MPLIGLPLLFFLGRGRFSRTLCVVRCSCAAASRGTHKSLTDRQSRTTSFLQTPKRSTSQDSSLGSFSNSLPTDQLLASNDCDHDELDTRREKRRGGGEGASSRHTRRGSADSQRSSADGGNRKGKHRIICRFAVCFPFFLLHCLSLSSNPLVVISRSLIIYVQEALTLSLVLCRLTHSVSLYFYLFSTCLS